MSTKDRYEVASIAEQMGEILDGAKLQYGIELRCNKAVKNMPIDFFYESDESITLIKVGWAKPPSTADMSDMCNMKKAVEGGAKIRNAYFKSGLLDNLRDSLAKPIHKRANVIYLAVGDFNLPEDSAIMDVARAVGVGVIHVKHLEEATQRLMEVMDKKPILVKSR